MTVELRQLQYFRHLARELSFGRAASRASVSQSSMSEQIMRLEDILGVKLVDRTRRQIGLTLAGELLRDEVGAILGDVDRLVGRVREAGGAPRATLRIGYSEMAVGTVMPTILHDFRQAHPETEPVLREQSSIGAEAALLDDVLDCVFIPGGAATSNRIETIVLGDEPVLACIAAGSPLAKADRLTLRDLRDAPIILPERGSNLETYLVSRFAALGMTPRVVGRAARALSMMTLVASEEGVAFIPQSLARLSRDDVVFRSLDKGQLHVPFSLMWKRENDAAPLRALIASIRQRAVA